ncbi:MAG: AraC family transcriptional regulator [Anaerolineaceae bacterium]|nr:AraC family transcriptional regulator [Anaerolineaceae bacterium]
MSKTTYTVSIDMLQILQHYLTNQGGKEAIFARELAGIIQELSAEDDRVSVETFAELWEKSLRSTRDKNFGLHFGKSASLMRSSGILFPVMMNCPTLQSALEKQARYHNLVTNFISLHLEETQQTTALYWVTADDAFPLDRHLVESIFCSLVLSLAEISRGKLKVNEIHFMHAPPAHIQEHQALLQCDLKFGQPRNEIRFESASLAQPVVLANPQLLERLEQVARDMQEQHNPPQTWGEQVSGVVRQALTQGDKPQLAGVARQLNISVRQLQNKLQDEGLTYQELLDEVRKAAALRYLKNPQMSACEIAFLLGFSEQSTFNHAFKRWTGLTPGAYRESPK